MKDNGLLKYYFEKKDEQKGLVLSDLQKRYGKDFLKVTHASDRCLIDDKPYFLKHAPQQEVDAEILLSQIYSKLGLNSAIYTPCCYSKEKFELVSEDKSFSPTLLRGVVSNDVSQDNIIQAKDFFARNKFGGYCTVINFYRSKGRYDIDLKDVYTENGAKDFLLMTALDVASGNTDRNLGNFFYNLDDNGKIDGVTTIDYGESGNALLKSFFKADYYMNYLGKQGHWLNTREETLDILKNGESVLEFTSPDELAEKIGSVDVQKTAEEIEETIDYKLMPGYVNFIESNFQQTAEDLTK